MNVQRDTRRDGHTGWLHGDVRLTLSRVLLILLLAGAASFFLTASTTASSASTTTVSAVTGDTIQRFLSCEAAPLTTYRALRRLKAANKRFKKEGWMVAWTELDPRTGFRYEIVDEGGSEYIRRRVLRKMLEGEREAFVSGQPARSSLSPDNYRFAADLEEGAIARIRITPLRKDGLLVDGAVVVDAESGDLLRIEGRLAKNPSFWTNRVDVMRAYKRIGGFRVPITVESTASVKIAGTSTFEMTYEYETINGLNVGNPSHVASAAIAAKP